MKKSFSVQESYSCLIIDDEMDICYLLGAILNRKNIAHNYATSLAESRLILNKRSFDLTFLDNYLPDGKGIDFILELKKKFPLMKVVLISAYADQRMREKMEHYPIDYFMPKPFHPDLIDNVIRLLLGNTVH